MDVQQMRKLKAKLKRFLTLFDDCFPRKSLHAPTCRCMSPGNSGASRRASGRSWLHASVPVRTLEFLSQHQWDHDQARDRLQEIVRDSAGPTRSGFLTRPATSRRRQNSRRAEAMVRRGGQENCIIHSSPGLRRDGFHCLLDGELFLPESWPTTARCREAGIPDDMVYRPKWKIALELYDRATTNALHFDWTTFDEGYGSKPEFLRELSARSQKFVGEVPRTSWAGSAAAGRDQEIPQARPGTRPQDPHSPAACRRRSVWMRCASGQLRQPALGPAGGLDGQKGPMVWEVKHLRFHPVNAAGLPGARCT